MATYTIKRAPDVQRAYRIDYASELNEAQLAAVTALEGPVLVVAGAGSGKTRTLTYRVARLVESGVAPDSILLLTFTRRAAQEMLRRAEALLAAGGLEGATGGTFHSFANTMLRRFGRRFGWPDRFTILDRGDAEDTINLVRTQLGLDRTERRFPRKQTLATIYSTAANKSLRIADVVEREYAHLMDDCDEIVACHAAYEAYKRERALLDYDDLLIHLRDRLLELPEFAARLRELYRWVMVDEYQDTNQLQADIVAAICAPDGNVMAVGDDAQSIYGFRGADFRNIMQFPARFPGARLITLEENYRSTQTILDLTNAIIAGAKQGYAKTLFTRKAHGARPQLVPAPDERWQSAFVRQRILELHEEGVPLTEIAVLFRSSFHSFDLELELARAAVPFVKRGGFRFVETAHVKDVLAHLRVVENPRDSVSWQRILLLLEGVGPKLAAAVVDWLAADARGVAALAEFPGSRHARGPALGALRQLGTFLASLDPAAPPVVLLQQVVTHYRPVLERIHRDDAPKRMRDLEQFVTLAERYRSLARMLADMALEPPSDTVGDVMAVDVEEGEMLTLSTVHSAKGLEWHTVFVISAADGRFPSAYSVGEDDLEEERRLLYVACTRARENLYLTYPTVLHERAVGPVVVRPSRFLADLPRGLLEEVTLVEEGAE